MRLVFLLFDLLDDLAGSVAADERDAFVVADSGGKGNHPERVGDLVSF